MSGAEDRPESYSNVSYLLTENDDVTKLTVTQDNIKDESSRDHSKKNWQMVLGGLKKMLEK